MSERERWVVYPLLFLALGAALRDKLSDRTITRTIKCQELLVVDERSLGEEVLLARIGRTKESEAGSNSEGEVVLNGRIDLVDRDPSGSRGATRLIRIGRAPLGPNSLAGLVDVNGQVIVRGIVNASFYRYQDVPLVPVLQGVIPGASIPAEMLRAVPEALSKPSETPQPSPPENSSSQSPAAPPTVPKASPPAEQTPPADSAKE